MKKKILSVVLTLVIIMTSCFAAFYAYAENRSVAISKNLLDSILNDRYWVVETLVNNDISNNPYAAVGTNYSGMSLMEEVLQNYQDDEAFSALVDAMDVYYNTGEYVSGFTDSVLTKLAEWFCLSDTSGVTGAVDDLVASTDELKYESILNEVLVSDYTSSWGETLLETNMELERMKQMASVLSKLSTYQAALKDAIGISGGDSEIVLYEPENSDDYSYTVTIEDYSSHFLDAYSEDLEKYLTNITEIPGLNGNEALEKKILSASALGMVTAYERVVLPEINDNVNSVFYNNMVRDTTAVLSVAGSVLDFSQKTMDTAILLEALQSQKKSTVATMTRLSEVTADSDLKKVLINYAELTESQGDELTLSYEAITNYLRNNTVVTDIVADTTAKAVTSFVKSAATKYAGATGLSLVKSIASFMKKVGIIVELGVWGADVAVGLEQTTQKVFLCVLLDRIIAETVNCYNIDLAAYNSSPTDENAQKVLDDLELLKKLRLFGEECAYGSMYAQLDSVFGQLLGGGATMETLEIRLQTSKDMYIGCTATPVSSKPFYVGSGQTLTLTTTTVNGKEVSYAIMYNADGTSYQFAEADNRLLTGVVLSDGTLNIESTVNGLCLSSLECEYNGNVNIFCSDVAVGSISNSSVLTISYKNDFADLEICEKLYNGGDIYINGYNSNSIDIYNIDNSGTINLSSATVNLRSNLKNNGTINGLLNICGGFTQRYENGYYSYGRQVIYGDGYGKISALSFNNSHKKGVKISGFQSVTGSVYNASSRLYGSENLKLTGNCSVVNDYFKGNLSFSNFTTDSALTLSGAAYIYDSVTFNNTLKLADGLKLTSGCSSLTLNGETIVSGDTVYQNGTINGTGKLILGGSLNVTASSPTISNLYFDSYSTQEYSGSTVTVENLSVKNTSLAGFTAEGIINVTGTFNAYDSKINNSENIVLLSTAVYLMGTTIKDDFTLSGNFTVKDGENYTFKGDLVLASGCNFVVEDGGTVAIEGNLRNNGGNILINQNACVTVNKNFTQSSGTSVCHGSLTVLEDTVTNTDLTGDGTYYLGGSLSANNNANNITNLYFQSDSTQEYSGKSITVENLSVKNNSLAGFTAESIINVTGVFNSFDSKINKSENIVLTSTAVYLTGTTVKEDLTLSGAFTVKTGESYTFKGDLTLTCTGNITVEDGGALVVEGGFQNNGGSISINENSNFTVNGNFVSQNGAVSNNGSFTIIEDAIITTALSGEGTYNFGGDVVGKSYTWEKPNVALIGKVPQSITGENGVFSVNNLNVQNESVSGITVDSNIYVNYYGTFTKNDCVINNESNIVNCGTEV